GRAVAPGLLHALALDDAVALQPDVARPGQPATALGRAARRLAPSSGSLESDPSRGADGPGVVRAGVLVRAASASAAGAGLRALLGLDDRGRRVAGRDSLSCALRPDHRDRGGLLLRRGVAVAGGSV